jgi:exodeoxyribonuclease V beta subunit
MIRYARPTILDQVPHDRHAVIEASAGTGKTHTIEHLVLDLLLNSQCPIDQILVVTFTEKATTELRGRIRALLENVLAGGAPPKHPGDAKVVELDADGERRLEAALFAFDRAPIFTIHAFCRRVLSELAFETRSGFEGELVDGPGAFHQAFRAEMREHLAVDPDSLALLKQWLSQDDSAARENLVDQLEKLLWEAHSHRYLASGGPARNAQALEALTARFQRPALIKASSALKPAKAQAAKDAVAALAKVIDTHDRKSPDSLRAALTDFDFSRLPDAKALAAATKSAGPPADIRELLDIVHAVRLAAPLEVRIVDAFLPPISLRLEREKRDRGRIDYDDMLEWVWRAIEGDGGDAAVGALRERFRYGIIDEFQDTDDLQWKIFRRIFLESGGKNLLYVVGDPKQAIYSFRGADVFTYLRARSAISDAGTEPIPLVENFRSSADLIAALNRILDQSAKPAVFSGEIKYDHPVTCGRPDLRALDARGKPIRAVALLRYAPKGGKASVARMRASLGRRIATEIRRIIHDPKHRITIHDGEPARQVEPRDIYILTRTGTESAEIGGYLREAGVPFAFYRKSGLFQTPEACDVLDILRAIEEPGSQSRRLRAWASPFFAVPYKNLFGNLEAPAGHPLNERLYEWKTLADNEDFGALFDLLLDATGLVSRELFQANSERELTNYLHLFEILLEVAIAEHLSLGEIIARLDSFISGSALPGGLDSDVQRLESERSAVQIMSVHMSKGLQAPIVFLFGGASRLNDRSKVWTYHDDNRERRVVIGRAARELVADRLAREAREENERLAYVAITRARVKLYIPVFPEGALKQKPTGYYAPLNERLQLLVEELEADGKSSAPFDLLEVPDTGFESADANTKLKSLLESWKPPEALLDPRDGIPEHEFDEQRSKHSALIVRSYTSLGTRPELRRDIEPEEFKYDVDTSTESADLRGGRSVGIFLHEVIEHLDLKSLEDAKDLAAWRARDDIQRLFADTMRRHHVTNQRWLQRGTEIVFNALSARIATPGGTLGPLHGLRSVREMEFIYPIPERAHPLLQSGGNGAWSVERGYLKGFVDFVFEQNGRHYFADWKSDLLEAYTPDVVGAHVAEHYDMQAKIYSVGIVRLLRIRTQREYDERFGGLLYLFLRGMKAGGPGADGVYFHRPDWNEIVAYERSLMEVAPPAPSYR